MHVVSDSSFILDYPHVLSQNILIDLPTEIRIGKTESGRAEVFHYYYLTYIEAEKPDIEEEKLIFPTESSLKLVKPMNFLTAKIVQNIIKIPLSNIYKWIHINKGEA